MTHNNSFDTSGSALADAVRDIRIADFDYPLPDGRIARHPLPQRDSCRLLVSLAPGMIEHTVFSDLPNLLPSGSLLVCNDTRVINARIRFRKETGSEIEVFLLEPDQPEDYVLMFQSRGRCRWNCMVGNLKRWKTGPLFKSLTIDGRSVVLRADRLEAASGNSHIVELSWDDDSIPFASVVEAAGYIPIPPYLCRASESSDADDYQTVYARVQGSVAAPTAGLHFTPEVFEALRQRDIDTQAVTLHVGAGTFQPVKSERIGDHPMHTETFSVSRSLVHSLVDAVREGRRITAVGTTSVRTLESLPYLGLHLLRGDTSMHVGQWEAYTTKWHPEAGETTLAALEALLAFMESGNQAALAASTSIMIAPGFTWRLADFLVTNFHQPQSTLLLLVSSFIGGPEMCVPRWRRIYDEALAQDYRFLSYGDACLFKRGGMS